MVLDTALGDTRSNSMFCLRVSNCSDLFYPGNFCETDGNIMGWGGGSQQNGEKVVTGLQMRVWGEGLILFPYVSVPRCTET